MERFIRRWLAGASSQKLNRSRRTYGSVHSANRVSIALYVHFPFCLSICPYCDFDRQATGFDRIDVYLEAVQRELAQYRGANG